MKVTMRIEKETRYKQKETYMNMEKKIFIRFLFAALLITAGCRKDDTPAEEKTPVGFRAMSQDVLVKSGDVPVRKSLHEYGINTFGVWGISRNDLNVQYLWNQPAANNTVQLVPVTAETVNGEEIYVPAEDGYWFSNSTHDFLALASAEPGTTNTFGTTGLSVTHTDAAGAQTNPVMTFTYDMSSKYNPGTGKTPDYTYDLLGAAARKEVEKVIPTSQDLVFWHLFSQIVINTSFDKDLNGNQIVGEVTAMHFKDVKASGNYIVKYKSDSELDVTPTANDTPLADISLTGSSVTLNIIPQDVKAFELYLDFRIKEGTEWVTYNNFKINLDVPQNKDPYIFNNKYNWNITIGTKATIKFVVSVNPWKNATEDDFDPEIDM